MNKHIYADALSYNTQTDMSYAFHDKKIPTWKYAYMLNSGPGLDASKVEKTWCIFINLVHLINRMHHTMPYFYILFF